MIDRAFTPGKLGGYTVHMFPPTQEPGDKGFAAIYVPSSTNPEEEYTVILDGALNTLECHCKGYTYRQTCKHVTLIRQLLSTASSKA